MQFLNRRPEYPCQIRCMRYISERNLGESDKIIYPTMKTTVLARGLELDQVQISPILSSASIVAGGYVLGSLCRHLTPFTTPNALILSQTQTLRLIIIQSVVNRPAKKLLISHGFSMTAAARTCFPAVTRRPFSIAKSRC